MLVAAMLTTACGAGSRGGGASSSPGPFPRERVTVSFGRGAEVRAEVAVTEAQAERGLMFRKHLGADDGMLFLFQNLGTGGFYMKNTLIPLSIAYMRRTANRTYRVVAVLDMDPCPKDTVQCPTYPPGQYYDATVEVNQGWFARRHVQVGRTAHVTGPIPNPFDQP